MFWPWKPSSAVGLQTNSWRRYLCPKCRAGYWSLLCDLFKILPVLSIQFRTWAPCAQAMSPIQRVMLRNGRNEEAIWSCVHVGMTGTDFIVKTMIYSDTMTANTNSTVGTLNSGHLSYTWTWPKLFDGVWNRQVLLQWLKQGTTAVGSIGILVKCEGASWLQSTCN